MQQIVCAESTTSPETNYSKDEAPFINYRVIISNRTCISPLTNECEWVLNIIRTNDACNARFMMNGKEWREGRRGIGSKISVGVCVYVCVWSIRCTINAASSTFHHNFVDCSLFCLLSLSPSLFCFPFSLTPLCVWTFMQMLHPLSS